MLEKRWGGGGSGLSLKVGEWNFLVAMRGRATRPWLPQPRPPSALPGLSAQSGCNLGGASDPACCLQALEPPRTYGRSAGLGGSHAASEAKVVGAKDEMGCERHQGRPAVLETR